MDRGSIADQVTEAVQSAPELLQGVGENPEAAIEQITGLSLGEADVAGVLEAIAPTLEDAGFDVSAITENASGLLENISSGEGLSGILSGEGVDGLSSGLEDVLGSAGDIAEDPLGAIGGFLGGLFGR